MQRCKELQDTEDGNLTARETQELQATPRAIYSSAHLLNIQDMKIFDKPIEERLEPRLSDLKAWIQVVQKGIQEAHTQMREGVQDIRSSFSGSLPHQEYSDPQYTEIGRFRRRNGSSSLGRAIGVPPLG
jgi:hypothetical protein